MRDKTFGSNISFDIEDQPKPKRRRNRPTREKNDSSGSLLIIKSIAQAAAL